jgi:transcriptional regulator with XRE-family HTH domain
LVFARGWPAPTRLVAKEDVDQLLRRIGRRIAELRGERELTQEEFAGRLDFSVKYTQRVEAGRQNLSVGSLVKLANTLDVAVADLFKKPRTLRANKGRPPKRR